jgi:hypothetical protein
MVPGKKDEKVATQSDLEMLERLQKEIFDKLDLEETKPKVGDLLKALELKLKLKLPEAEKEKIWELINQLREEELSSKPKRGKRKS